MREQRLLSTVLTELRKQLPFALLGLDTDNDSVFMNETLKEYCEQADIVFTRCRPYRKNDQAFVEQKNGAVVRRMVGYGRFEGLEAAALLAQLYRSARLFVNFFQPSFKLIRKERDGARVHKTYSAPATPHQRLVAEARTPDAVRARVNEIYAGLDPVALLRDIRAVQEQLANLTDAAPASHPTAMPPIEQFLSSLRIAWKDGAGRPTDTPIAKPKRERRRPDPLVKATPQLRMVRGRAVADQQRTPVQASGRKPRGLPAQSAPNSSTSSQVVAQRASKRTGVWLWGKRGTKRRDRHITGKPAAAG